MQWLRVNNWIPSVADTGRPSRYKSEYSQQAYKLCLLLGATDKNLADYFDVSEATINNWKHQHPEFLESLKAGKEEADARVGESLYQRHGAGLGLGLLGVSVSDRIDALVQQLARVCGFPAGLGQTHILQTAKPHFPRFIPACLRGDLDRRRETEDPTLGTCRG